MLPPRTAPKQTAMDESDPDDLLATGGTARATTDLVKQLGGHVEGLAFLIELVALNGRAKLAGEQLHTVLQY